MSTGSCRRRCSIRSWPPAATSSSSAASLDLTKGSGNAAAFKGTATLGTVLDGTGPFVMSSDTPGSQVVLVRNPNYWNQAGLAHLDKIVFRIEPDLATEEKDVRSGAVQVGLNLGLAALPALEAAVRAAHGAADRRPGGGLGRRGADVQSLRDGRGSCDNPAADENEDTADPTIRKAILLGIDRQAIVKAVAPGITTVPPDSWMNLGASYLSGAGVPTTGFDPATANSMLDAAGDTRDAKCGSRPGRPGLPRRQGRHVHRRQRRHHQRRPGARDRSSR